LQRTTSPVFWIIPLASGCPLKTAPKASCGKISADHPASRKALRDLIKKVPDLQKKMFVGAQPDRMYPRSGKVLDRNRRNSMRTICHFDDLEESICIDTRITPDGTLMCPWTHND
jgi:hypothetical protein